MMGSSLSSLTLETLFTPNSKMHKLFNTATSITTLQHLITASAYLTMWHNNGHCTVVHVALCLKPHCVCYCRMHKERLDLLLVACDASIIACPCHFGIHSIMMHDAPPQGMRTNSIAGLWMVSCHLFLALVGCNYLQSHPCHWYTQKMNFSILLVYTPIICLTTSIQRF